MRTLQEMKSQRESIIEDDFVQALIARSLLGAIVPLFFVSPLYLKKSRTRIIDEKVFF